MNSWGDDRPHDIIEEEPFKLQAAEFAGSVQRWDEISWAITHDIARHPHFVVPPVIGTRNLYSVLISSDPPLLLHYRVDDARREIHLLEIELA
jgi:hypothetical protein